MKREKQIPSVNFHLWKQCNMKCKFCFATFHDIKQTNLLSKEEGILLIQMIANAGFQKITFVGGEPTLCPWLEDLIDEAKDCGLTTMIVTNGSMLTDDFLKRNQKRLDWIGLSIDSLNTLVNEAVGRTIKGSAIDYYSIVERINKYHYKLKINTVVNATNYFEDMNNFISFANPKRWKVMQVLPIQGQNDKYIEQFLITREKFMAFVNRHQNRSCMVDESNQDMINSYIMIDPFGRFFSDKTGYHTYSKSILEVGIDKAIAQMDYNFERFIQRGGKYQWDTN